MLSLALETSHREASVALDLDGHRVERHLDPELKHASDCLALLAELISAEGAQPMDIDRIVVGIGPGSYTGLRIGIATALGLARGAEAELRGVPSGEALIWRELEPGDEAVYLLDARQEQLYYAHYKRSLDEVEVLAAPTVLGLTELSKRLPSSARILGDQKAIELAQLTTAARERFVTTAPPAAGALLDLGTRRLDLLGGQRLEEVEPLYLRPFQAKTRRR